MSDEFQNCIKRKKIIKFEKGLLDHSLVEALQLGKTLRENADYYGEFSKEAATQMIEDTEEFLEVAKNLTLN